MRVGTGTIKSWSYCPENTFWCTVSLRRVRVRDCLSSVHTSNNVEATFDFVGKNGNNVERVLRWNFVLSTKSNVASTMLPKTATLSKQQAIKLPVASTLLLVWTELYSCSDWDGKSFCEDRPRKVRRVSSSSSPAIIGVFTWLKPSEHVRQYG